MKAKQYRRDRRQVRSAQLPSSRRRHPQGQGDLGLGCRRPEIPRFPERLFGGQPGALPPANPEGVPLPARERYAHVPRFPQRPVAAPCPGALPDDGLRHGPADELRRRSGRNGDQDRPKVGLPEEERSRRPGRDHRLLQQLPRPDDLDHQLLDRAALPGRFRTVHSRIQDHSLQRHRGPGTGHHADHGGVHRRAHPGRGGDPDPLAGVPKKGEGDLRQE